MPTDRDAMPTLDLILDGDGAYAAANPATFAGAAPLADGKLNPLGKVCRVVALAAGMKSGLPSVVVELELPNGTRALGETSARLFVNAGRAIAARYPAIDAD